MNDNNKNIQDLSFLYELSLSVGTSFDVKENCAHFLNILMARKNVSIASIWLKEEGFLNLVYGTPENIFKENSIFLDHFIWEKLDNVSKFVTVKGDEIFEKCILEKNIKKGTFAFYKLGKIGFLKLYALQPNSFDSEMFTQLSEVIQKFSFLLSGCIAHEKLLLEQEQRMFIQRALHASETRHRSVVENLSEGIIITDLEGKVTFVNKQMEELTGFSKEELKGNKSYELLANKENGAIMRKNIEQRRKGVSQDYAMELIHKSGAKWLGRIKASPYKNNKGEIVGAMGAVIDITSQQLAEIRVRESEQMLRKVIDTSLDAVINIDENGDVVEWSAQATNIFGYTRAEAIGQNMGDLIVPHQHREAHARGMEHFLKTGEGPVLNNRIEITAIDKTEREFPIELSISPLKIEGKHYFSGFMRDITDRKKNEQDLISAKQEAEQAQLAEQQFLANMSHEIRTPMNAVIGMTHLLYETNPTDDQKEYLDSLRFSADSLMGIISNILDLSKIEANELEFEQRTFNLLELLKSLQQTFQFKVREKPISVVLEMDPKIENYLIGDSVRLTQILTNLLGNASKFTRRGTIGVKTKMLAATGGQYILQFQIHDTGIGIDTDNIEKIFENFKQADVKITRKFGGTGLGLTIVKQLVELQSGSIEVTSQKDKGSTFTVVLPFKDSGIAQSEVSFQEDLQHNISETLKTTNILIVEDNPMNQKLIVKIMELWECPFDIASSGLIALKKTIQKKYDIILMDIHMPEMDGCETTIRLKADKNNLNQKTPIIALTAAALLEEKNRALESGMDDFLTKPFSPKQLQNRLANFLNIEVEEPDHQINTLLTQGEVVNIDFTYLLEMSRGDQSFVKEMIEIFLSEIPTAMQQLADEVEQKNWTKISNISHRIKSNYMMLGMKVQQENALTIETSIKNNDFEPEEIVTRLHQLKSDSKIAYPMLEEELKRFSMDN